MTRNELADLSNMTTSNAVRTLRSFQEEGVVALNGRRIKVLDEEKLQRISRLG
ncbi:helix-turn-helix domain-containing protein [Porphyromonas sp. CAG:1061]|uniref:helix-turn-helix domain-containing protein n=1 Tax=Porphyromonas sp. CAG:1061 TaxID=1262916 RepID=UPI00338F4FEC